MISEFGQLNNKASEVVAEFYELSQSDPDKGIARLDEFIEKARDVNPVRGYESIAGGPNHDWIAPLINIIGTLYPELQ